jgi:hypothetical protein
MINNRMMAVVMGVGMYLASYAYANSQIIGLGDLDISKITSGWGRPAANQSVEQNPLTIGGRVFPKGLGLHAACSFTVDVSGADRFTAYVGIDDEAAAGPGSVNFLFYGDGQLLWQSGVMKPKDTAKKADLDLSSVAVLKIEIDPTQDGNRYDHADIAEAYFNVTGNAPQIIDPPLPPARWELGDKHDIMWAVGEDKNLPHKDFIEMSGQYVSIVLYYTIDADRQLSVNRRLIWPTLRTVPNDTHASLIHDFDNTLFFRIECQGQSILPETIHQCRYDGIMHFAGITRNGLAIRRSIAPAVDRKAAVETVTLTNTTDKAVDLTIASPDYAFYTDPQKGVYGQYFLDVAAEFQNRVTLKPGQTYTMSLLFRGRQAQEKHQAKDVEELLEGRRQFVDFTQKNLQFECPDAMITRMFELAKIRAADSVFQTKGGPMFAPGGERYYAAIWANDNAEYQGPFAPFLGEAMANEAAMNAYRHFARFMNDEFKPIPSSIIAEGTDIWNGAGDRGDAAMIAYGAARYALARGDKEIASELWPLIQWCLEYCRRQETKEGVIASDCDELEGRFPAGNANLCTAALTYDALLSASMLARELKKETSLAQTYMTRAADLRKATVQYFSANVEGFETWRYYDGNTVLRSWICVPYTMGMDERKEGTMQALFSDRLWTRDGLATQAGAQTFWDRSTLYALRGVYAIGQADVATEKLSYYSGRRLVGEHVPYPVEAYPEGNQRHLAAESALYCRVITEGLFGVRPTGLSSFRCTPRLPAEWNQMSLRNIRAFNTFFDIHVKREGKAFLVQVENQGKNVLSKLWDGSKPLEMNLSNTR